MDQFLSPKELAGLLGVPIGTVYRWNYDGSGPKRHVIGKHVRYRVADIETWLASRSDPRPAA